MKSEDKRELTRNLREAIDELYRRFAPYRLPPLMDPDPAFPWECDETPLRAAELNELPWQALHGFIYKSIYTWGSVSNFKHFLPRILELAATKEMRLDFDVEIAFEKLNYARWRTWPLSEKRAIDRFLAALWDDCLQQPIESLDSFGSYCISQWWLDQILKIDDRPHNYLDHWRRRFESKDTMVLAAAQLAASYLNMWHPITPAPPDWSDVSVCANRLLCEWLLDPQSMDHFEAAFFACEDEFMAEVIADGCDWLRRWHRLH